MALSINEAVSKYGGEDEAYKNKLKEGIRDAMGYSNFSTELARTRKSNPNINLKGDLNPATILGNIDSAFGRKQSEVSSLQGAMRTVDTAAGSIASSQVATGKAAQEKFGTANGVAFDPQSQLETQIADYMKNPYNPDGSKKSLQQFEAETNAYYSQEDKLQTGPKVVDANGNPVPYRVYSPEDIKAEIEKRVPRDFIGNEQTYSAMALGYSKKQATDPSTSGAVRDAMMIETKTVLDPTTGKNVTETIPKWTKEEIQNKYPDLSPADVLAIVKPAEKRSMMDDLQKNPLLGNIRTLITNAIRLNDNPDVAYLEMMTHEGKEYEALTMKMKKTVFRL